MRPNGIQYEGDFINDLYEGNGVLIENTTKYKGQFYQGMKHGKGTEEDKVLQFYYEGEWSNNAKTGFGREMMSDGSVYTGYFLEGKKHGEGRLTLPTGAEFQGEFNLDKIEGKVYKLNDIFI